MASGAFVPSVRAAGLERAARLAGEAFGHEESAPLARLDLAAFHPARWLARLTAGLAAVAGLLAPGAR